MQMQRNAESEKCKNLNAVKYVNVPMWVVFFCPLIHPSVHAIFLFFSFLFFSFLSSFFSLPNLHIRPGSPLLPPYPTPHITTLAAHQTTTSTVIGRLIVNPLSFSSTLLNTSGSGSGTTFRGTAIIHISHLTCLHLVHSWMLLDGSEEEWWGNVLSHLWHANFLILEDGWSPG